MDTWQLQDAKARFSEVVRRAGQHGPQAITVRGKPEVVLLSKAEFDRLSRPKPSFAAFLQDSPLMEIELDIERDQSTDRAVDL
ncbi:MAG: type II toxin-antitoxin system Phd/YefM family antitoxin [Magnetococcales bacterium]|nr:type II toxin-antitoxin system Phd/YefM family antitoxin [Magnetococcales bacterium]